MDGVAASIHAESSSTPAADDMPGDLVFSTTLNGNELPTERMRLGETGRLLLGTVEKRLDGIDNQLKRNGGSSLRDAVDRIEERQHEMRDYVVRTADRLDEHIDWHLQNKEK